VSILPITRDPFGAGCDPFGAGCDPFGDMSGANRGTPGIWVG